MRSLTKSLALSLLALALLFATVTTVHAQSRTHVVQPGENLFRIGLRYGVTVEALMRLNGLTSIYIYVGQTLLIPDTNAPAAPSPAAQPAPPAASTQPTSTDPVYHIVQPGETLFTIGLRYNMPWTKIAAANNIIGDRVYVGQRLVIPGGDAPAAAQPPAPAPTAEPTTPPAEPQPAATEAAAPASDHLIHIVQRGETLFTIGVKYNLKWTTIMAANNLPNDRIYVGQQLTIPASPEAIAAAEAAAPAQPPPSQGPVAGMSGKYFLVDLSEQRLYAFEGDTLVRSTLISSGRWPYPTVTGTYYIYARYTSTRMRGPGYDLPNVPYTQYFYKGYGLHGTYWHNNFGTPMSHGCVNMPTPEAEWAFYWAAYGTPVIVQP